jgi:hypothetical protein
LPARALGRLGRRRTLVHDDRHDPSHRAGRPVSGDRLTGAGIALAFALGACFLALAARRPSVPSGRRRRARLLLAAGLRLLYLVAGLLLVVRAGFALSALV